MENKKAAHKDSMKMLDACYAKAFDGIPLVSPSVADMANDYLEKYSKKEDAIKAMLKIKLFNALPPFYLQIIKIRLDVNTAYFQKLLLNSIPCVIKPHKHKVSYGDSFFSMAFTSP